MDNFTLSSLVSTGYSPIAETIYGFLASKNALPETLDVIDALGSENNDMDKCGSILNLYFINELEKCLLSLVPEANQALAKSYLHVSKSCLNKATSKEESYLIFLGSKFMEDPGIENLNELYQLFKNFDFSKLNADVITCKATNLMLPMVDIMDIREIVERYVPIYTATEETFWVSVPNCIIEIKALKDQIDTSNDNCNARSAYKEIRDIIFKRYPNIDAILNDDPEFLFLYEDWTQVNHSN